MSGEDNEITTLLQRIRGGDLQAESALLPVVYRQLHHLAQGQFRFERAGHTLQPTALVNELYMRIVRHTSIDWQSRGHFYTIAAQTMRRILVDHARSRNAQRRPNPSQRVSLDDVFAYSEDRADEMLVIDQALTRLAEWDARQARVVELRFFAGLSVEETAQALGIGERTVKRDWEMARAWLSRALNDPEQAT